jgi:hypothetical protein
MISFWGWSYEVPGGVQTLIMNIGKEANKRHEQIKLFGYKNSFLYKILINENVSFSFVSINNLDKLNYNYYISPDDVFIITGYDKDLPILVEFNPKIIFWVVFPSTIIEANSFKRIHLSFLTKSFYKFMVKNASIYFMDIACIKVAEHFLGHNLPKDIFIPIPINIPPENYYYQKFKVRNSHEFCISYIGRAVEFKLYPFLKIFLDLERYISQHNNKISLHVITDDISYYKRNISEGKLKCAFHNDLYGNKLSDFLLNNIDLNISMGTSCLESASLGIPSLLIDASNIKFPETYLYRWLYETSFYCLGEIINSTQTSFQGEKLSIIINKLANNNESCKIESAKCYNYVLKNHTIYKTYSLLVEMVKKSNVNLRDASKYLIRSNRFFY